MTVLAVIATGGTIQNTAGGRIAVEQLWSEICERSAEARRLDIQTRVTEVTREGSERFGPANWIAIARAVQHAADDPDVAAVLITHGTFSLEETAFYLHLVVRSEKPIVVTCSQRRHGDLGNDGDRNFVDAIRVAACEAAAGLGILVVVGEEVHSAREVTKTNQRPGGFSSGSLGLLGSVESDRVSLYRAPLRRHTYRSEFTPPTGPLPRVEVVSAYAGADDTAINAFIRAGVGGLVVNGFAYSGEPYYSQWPTLQRHAEDGLPVVLVSRGGNGRVPIDERVLPFISGDIHSAQKARVLLSLALATTRDRATLQSYFDRY